MKVSFDILKYVHTNHPRGFIDITDLKEIATEGQNASRKKRRTDFS